MVQTHIVEGSTVQLFEDNKGNSVGMMKNENEILRLEK